MAVPTAPGQTHAKFKRAEMERLLDHLDVCLRKRLPPLITVLAQGCKGEVANKVRRDIAAVQSLIKRVNPEVMRWGNTADRLRYQNLVHNFDAQLRSAELRLQDKERRRFARIEVDLPVRVTRGRASHEARALNISPDGVRLRSSAAHQVGDTVEIDALGRGPLGRVQGKVVWSSDDEGEGFHAGVKFVALEAEAKESIRRFLEQEQERRPGCGAADAEVKKP